MYCRIIRLLYIFSEPLELLSKIGDIKFFWNVLKAMYILKGPLFWQDQRKVSNNCKKIEFQLFSFLEINEFLFHTFVCHHILMKWFIFGRLCLCYCWNIAKNQNLLLFLWFQKIGPFKMYMALRTLQNNFMSRFLITTLNDNITSSKCVYDHHAFKNVDSVCMSWTLIDSICDILV